MRNHPTPADYDMTFLPRYFAAKKTCLVWMRAIALCWPGIHATCGWVWMLCVAGCARGGTSYSRNNSKLANTYCHPLIPTSEVSHWLRRRTNHGIAKKHVSDCVLTKTRKRVLIKAHIRVLAKTRGTPSRDDSILSSLDTTYSASLDATIAILRLNDYHGISHDNPKV